MTDGAPDGGLGAFAELFGLAAPEAEDDHPGPARRGLFRRLREGITSSQSQAISPQLAGIYRSKMVTDELWQDLEEALIMADCGMAATNEIVDALREQGVEGRITSGESLGSALTAEITGRLASEPARIALGDAPTVILVVGVNGSGKTTTIGKLANRLTELGQKVVIGAADTFRAAAVEQLSVWADRAGVDIVKQGQGADPGAVAFDAVAAGRARGADVVIIDTAGRLQTQHNLMEELRKVHGVTGKAMDGAPHHVLLVIDSTTGQNGLSQAQLFSESVPVTGLVLTKFDGVARGGIVLAIGRELGIPVVLMGVGEGIDDLQPFDAQAFAEAIFSPGSVGDA
ncbi:MAG: signal recognition particle-docking protein FtsY [Actinobacteria bacterium]|nr:signal recognition particle-docking protein FtsY [Actinomycetota bacterium]